jgi:hypothetical protein
MDYLLYTILPILAAISGFLGYKKSNEGGNNATIIGNNNKVV